MVGRGGELYEVIEPLNGQIPLLGDLHESLGEQAVCILPLVGLFLLPRSLLTFCFLFMSKVV